MTQREAIRAIELSKVDPVETDRREVEAYLTSETFQRVPPWIRGRLRRKTDHAWPNRDLTPGVSFWMCLVGFSLAQLMISAVSAVALYEFYEDLDAANDYVLFCVLGQVFLFPMVIGLAFTTVTPLFWHGSVLSRFALAVLVVLPGSIVFVLGFGIEGVAESSFAMFLSVAVAAVFVQLWTQWTISHSRPLNAPIAPTGTRSIMELTGIASVCFAILASFDTTDIALTIGLSVAVGSLASAAVIGIVIAFLRPGQRNLLAALIASLFAMTCATVVCGAVAIFGFGLQTMAAHIPEITGVTSLGAVYVFVLLMMGIAWLRACGWVCLNHEQERHARQAEADNPWDRWFPSDK